VEGISDLVERLRAAGVPVDDRISEAMNSVDLGNFTDYDTEPFLMDKPVPFLVTESGAAKTISAPHMVATLLHHLEIREGQHVLLMGSKGGYLASLLDCMLGPDGAVTIIEPHPEVLQHTSERLELHHSMGLLRALPPDEVEGWMDFSRRVDRVLVTGAVRELAPEVEMMVEEGGFVLGPFGGPLHQRLLKRERQGNDWMDTDLGGVVFGPMDLAESERSPLDPHSLAEHLEDLLDLMAEVIEIEEETIDRLEGLILSLRDLPIDLPLLDEESTEDEILEHPVMELLLMEMEWLGPMWPLFGDYLSVEMANPGSPEDDDQDMFGGHEDLIP
jgi:protein-L-isoaspartate(D-aspartate) O-methyltransferase